MFNQFSKIFLKRKVWENLLNIKQHYTKNIAETLIKKYIHALNLYPKHTGLTLEELLKEVVKK